MSDLQLALEAIVLCAIEDITAVIAVSVQPVNSSVVAELAAAAAATKQRKKESVVRPTQRGAVQQKTDSFVPKNDGSLSRYLSCRLHCINTILA
jgi:hypothetical protein